MAGAAWAMASPELAASWAAFKASTSFDAASALAADFAAALCLPWVRFSARSLAFCTCLRTIPAAFEASFTTHFTRFLME
eukprot:13963171-Alexandrium_andersonii.AAC.1